MAVLESLSEAVYWSHSQKLSTGVTLRNCLLESLSETVYWSHSQKLSTGVTLRNCLLESLSETVYWSHCQKLSTGVILRNCLHFVIGCRQCYTVLQTENWALLTTQNPCNTNSVSSNNVAHCKFAKQRICWRKYKWLLKTKHNRSMSHYGLCVMGVIAEKRSKTNKQKESVKLWKYRGFPTRMVHLYYISCLRYTILVGNPRYVSIVYLYSAVCSPSLFQYKQPPAPFYKYSVTEHLSHSCPAWQQCMPVAVPLQHAAHVCAVMFASWLLNVPATCKAHLGDGSA